MILHQPGSGQRQLQPSCHKGRGCEAPESTEHETAQAPGRGAGGAAQGFHHKCSKAGIPNLCPRSSVSSPGRVWSCLCPSRHWAGFCGACGADTHGKESTAPPSPGTSPRVFLRDHSTATAPRGDSGSDSSSSSSNLTPNRAETFPGPCASVSGCLHFGQSPEQ